MKKHQISIVFANVLDHFDANLYGFIAAVMAPFFFPAYDPMAQLILAYGFLATSAITRPLGILIFGRMVQKFDPTFVLRLTLAGVGFFTFLMGCIPTFNVAGAYAPFLLLLVRGICSIFAAGENAIAHVYLLHQKNSVATNAWFESSVILGCLLASLAASYVGPQTWRIPFWIGGLLTLCVLPLRLRDLSQKSWVLKDERIILQPVKGKVWSFLFVVLTGGVGYMTYDLSFILMNTFVPLVTSISREAMMGWNAILLLFDLFLFCFVGYFVSNRQVNQILRFSSLMLAAPAVPLFHFMQGASLFYVLFVRLWIVFWGVMFSCVVKVALLDLFPYPKRYLWLGIGCTAGVGLIGRSTSAFCLWGWSVTHWSAMPGIYLCVFASLVFLMTLQRRSAVILEK